MKPYKPLKQDADRDEGLSEYSGPLTDEDGYPSLQRNNPTPRWRRWPISGVALVALVLSNVAWTLLFIAGRSGQREMNYCKPSLADHTPEAG